MTYNVKEWIEERARLEARVVELEKDKTRLDWIEANTTLHNSVETGYYVDHYEAVVISDQGKLDQRNVGEDLRDAIDAAKGGE